MMNTAGYFAGSPLPLLAWQVGIHVENLFRVQEGKLLRQVRVFRVLELREEFLRVALGADHHLPDLGDDRLQEIKVALFGRDHALPVPLIDIGAVVVVEEVVFAHARTSVHRPSPGCMPNCFSAILFHLVAACTTWLDRMLSRSFEMWTE